MTVSTDAKGLDLRALLRPGDRIVWGQACGEPTTLVEALIEQAAGIGRVSAFAATSFSGILSADAADKFSLSSTRPCAPRTRCATSSNFAPGRRRISTTLCRAVR
jgi:acyl-CoA hydrolase